MSLPTRGPPARRTDACITGARPPRARRQPIPKDWITLKKQVLVSVDRAETRVALLEAGGTPAASSSTTRKRCRGSQAFGRESELTQARS